MVVGKHTEDIIRLPVHDVVIIGAGPCGLAVATRLCELTPSAIFTDDEHARYHWINKHGNRVSLKNRKNGKVQPAQLARKHPYDILVLDSSSNQWLANWNRLFKTFGISHLRSPMFFHVDPADRDSLLAHAHTCRQENELREICNCVGKEISKHKRKATVKRKGKANVGTKVEIDERDRKDYFTPPATLFADHCKTLVERYQLGQGMVRQETVVDIDFGLIEKLKAQDNIFTLKTEKGLHYARTAVLAVGSGCKPTIPLQIQRCINERTGQSAEEEVKMKAATNKDDTSQEQCVKDGDVKLNLPRMEGVCHSMAIEHFPDMSVQRKINAGQSTRVLVIGGGLTSAQLGDLALRRGVTTVYHVMRSRLKVKPFDVDLEWMSKFRNQAKASFWSSNSDADRLAAVKSARGGGSVNQTFARILQNHMGSGRLRLFPHTTIHPCEYDRKSHTWRVQSSPPNPDLESVTFDYIYFATGLPPDIRRVECLRRFRSKFPLPRYDGLPCLGQDLEWWGNDAGANSVLKEGESPDWTRTNHDHHGEANDGETVDASVDPELPTRIPLFITGSLAALRLGPGAGNLEGARLGAERIALGIQEYLGDRDSDGDGDVDDHEKQQEAGSKDQKKTGRISSMTPRMYNYAAGIGSRFDSLTPLDGGVGVRGYGGDDDDGDGDCGVNLEFEDLFVDSDGS